MAIVDRVRELVVPVVGASSAELYDIEHNGAVVRVLVDHPDGLDLDAIAELSRSISRTLDEHDPIPGRYTLEVSSPGLERRLRTPEHFRRAIASKVKIKIRPGYEGPRRLTGVIVDADERSVRLRGDGDEVVTVEMADIDSARTVFEWGPGPKPGGRRDSGKSDREATSS